jgi:predicted HTH domain antitoxin
MIAHNGESKLSLSEADLKVAIQLFIEQKSVSRGEKVKSIQVHRTGSKYAVSVTVRCT